MLSAFKPCTYLAPLSTKTDATEAYGYSYNSMEGINR